MSETVDRHYLDIKIQQIEQDIRDNENEIVSQYKRKAELVVQYAETLERIGEIATDKICAFIVNRLAELDCARGISTVYKSIPNKYKNSERSELTKLGISERSSNVEISRLYKLPPYANIDLRRAPAEQMQANEEYYEELAKEVRRQHNEYLQRMHERGIAVLNRQSSDVISTPEPYSPKKGHLWEEAAKTASALYKFADTYTQIQENIYKYPPRAEGHERLVDCTCQECEAIDTKLAKGLENWTLFYSYLYEYHRPFADKKFAQSYVRWFETEILNEDHGKHAAAVMSKVDSHLGVSRTLTREQVGDKQREIYQKSIKFAGVLELTNFLVEGMPSEWHDRMQVPVIAHRRTKVGPILSESAFGSDKK